MPLSPALDRIVRDFFRALGTADAQLLDRVATPHKDLSRLLNNPWPALQRDELAREVSEMQINGRGSQGSRHFVHAFFRGMMFPLVVLEQGHGPRVDARYWVTAADTQNEKFRTAREYMFGLATCNEEILSRLSIDARGIELLLGNAPPAGEHDQYANVCANLPLAELELGDQYVDLDGTTQTVSERHKEHGIAVMLGLFESAEIPFLMRRIEGQWRVSPAPYIRAAVAARGGTIRPQ